MPVAWAVKAPVQIRMPVKGKGFCIWESNERKMGIAHIWFLKCKQVHLAGSWIIIWTNVSTGLPILSVGISSMSGTIPLGRIGIG